MNRQEIIETIVNLQLPKEHYWVTSGAGLVIHGVKETTSDVDLGCDSRLFELLSPSKKIKQGKNNQRILKLSEIVEVIENWFVDTIVMVEGIPVADLLSIKKQKEVLGREKDLQDTWLIDNFIKEREQLNN